MTAKEYTMNPQSFRAHTDYDNHVTLTTVGHVTTVSHVTAV